MASRLVEKISLYYREGTKHDKIYHIELTEEDGGFRVMGYNGRRGARLTPQSKTPHPVSYRTARHIFDELLYTKLNHRQTPYRVASREVYEATGTDAASAASAMKPVETHTDGQSEREQTPDALNGAYLPSHLDALEY